VSAVNECPRCGKLADDPEGNGVCALYAGVCSDCWRVAHPGEPLPVPSQEFFAPSNIAKSKLFKAGLDAIWESADVSKFDTDAWEPKS